MKGTRSQSLIYPFPNVLYVQAVVVVVDVVAMQRLLNVTGWMDGSIDRTSKRRPYTEDNNDDGSEEGGWDGVASDEK